MLPQAESLLRKSYAKEFQSPSTCRIYKHTEHCYAAQVVV
jgi:hypothetical protein